MIRVCQRKLGQVNQILGDQIDKFAQWNGASWTGLEKNPPLLPTSIRPAHGLLYATAPGSSVALSRWNGHDWAFIPDVTAFAPLVSLSSYGGNLLVVGHLLVSNSPREMPAAAWTGTQWLTFGSDLIGPAISAVEYQGDLIVSGSSFLRLASDSSALGIFRYDGNAWRAWPVSLSTSGILAVYQGKLLVGSNEVRDMASTSYGALAQWEGDHWEKVGGVFPLRESAAGACQFSRRTRIR